MLIGLACVHLLIDFGKPEFLQPPDFVSGLPFALSPAVDGSFGSPQVLGDVVVATHGSVFMVWYSSVPKSRAKSPSL